MQSLGHFLYVLTVYVLCKLSIMDHKYAYAIGYLFTYNLFCKFIDILLCVDNTEQ